MSKEAEKISDAMEYIDDGMIRETDILRSEAAKSVKAKNRGRVTSIRSQIVRNIAAAAAILIVGTGAGIAIHHNLISNKSMSPETTKTFSLANVNGIMASDDRQEISDGFDMMLDEEKIASPDAIADLTTSGISDYDNWVHDDFGGPESVFFLDSPLSSTMCMVRVSLGELDIDKNFCELSFIVDVEEEGVSYLVSDDYIIQQYVDGQWCDVKSGDTTDFVTNINNPMGFSVSHTDEVAKQRIDWTDKYGLLDPGDYRLVVKLYRKESGGTRPFTRKIHLMQE